MLWEVAKHPRSLPTSRVHPYLDGQKSTMNQLLSINVYSVYLEKITGQHFQPLLRIFHSF